MPNPNGQQIQSTTIPSPTGGWNRRDSLGVMPETDAIVMDNFISTGGYVKLRSGYKTVLETPGQRGPTLGAPIETLCPFTAGLEDEMIFSCMLPGAASADIYAIDEFAERFDSIMPHLLNGQLAFNIKTAKWKDLQFQGRLFLVSDGLEAPLVYDGTVISKHAFTVPKPEDLDFKNLTAIASYNRRLFFIEKSTLNLWFTKNVGVIQGALESIDLSDYATRGGELVQIEEWTRTGANDMSSMLVAITSEGEVFMFTGGDPTSIDDWTLSGIYLLPSPIGFDCATRMMGDLVFMTSGGYYTAQSLTSVKETTKDMAISDKIRGAIDGLRTYWDNDGWQIIFLQSYNLLFVNVPISRRQSQQFVYNLENQTWSRFTGINAYAFCSFKDKIYFGGLSGGISELFAQSSDNGLTIAGTVQTAFSTFQIPQKKLIKSVSVNVGTPFAQDINLRLSCDFVIQPSSVITTEGVAPSMEFSDWDETLWDEGIWGVYTKAEQLDVQEIKTPMDGKVARAISLCLQTSVATHEDIDFVLDSTTFAYEKTLQ